MATKVTTDIITDTMDRRRRHTMAHITVAAGWGMLRDCFLRRHIMGMVAVARLAGWVGCWVVQSRRIMDIIAIMLIMEVMVTTTMGVGNREGLSESGYDFVMIRLH